MAKADILKPFILSWEGGFVNDPADAGGATYKGVTLATFRNVFGSRMAVSDLKRMTDAQWLTIFKRYYWDRWKADDINDQSLANTLVDWVWGSGLYGITIPQRLLGVVADGKVGPKTLAALNKQNPKDFFDKIKERRTGFLMSIVTARPANRKFLNGWMNRLNAIGYGILRCNGGQTIRF